MLGRWSAPSVGVLKQWQQALERVSVGDTTAQRPPEPFGAVGVWIVGGRVHQHELATQLSEQLAQQERALGRVDAQVVQQHQSHPPARLGTLHGAAHLGTERRSPSAGRPLPVQPAVAPVDQSAAVLGLE